MVPGFSSGIIKNGSGNLRLTAANSYDGLTTINNGFILIDDPLGLGGSAQGTVLNADGDLSIVGASVVTESLTCNSASSILQASGVSGWSGNVVLNAQLDVQVITAGTFDISGPISGIGALTKTVTGTLRFSGGTANTYAGITTVNEGLLELNKSPGIPAIVGNLVIGDGVGGANADVVRLLNNGQIASSSDVQVNSSGLLDLGAFSNFIDELSGNGNLTFGVSGFVGVGDNNGSSTFDGIASGTGYVGGWTIGKFGSGTFTLNGNNTYLNETYAAAGTMIINGSQPQSPLVVTPAAAAGGSGTVGHINCGGNLQPGTSPGCLTSSNLVFTAAADFCVELTGTTPCSGHDQLVVRGTADLANATLQVVNSFPPGEPNVGDQFVILDNDGIDVITGTFNGLANNATFNVGGIGYRINYDGGSGNDVVLTVLNAPGATVTINATDSGWFDSTGFHAPGNPNYFVGQEAAENWHDWFVFNIPQFAGTIVQAELIIHTRNFQSPNTQETFVLRHVSTAIGTLVAGGSGLTAIYDDLADGPVYSIRDLLAVEEQQRAIIPLNLTFINDATAAAGGQIALGGSLDALVPGSDRYWFGATGGTPSDVQLRLTFGTSTLLNASARGWYGQSGNHSAANQNYFVGESGGELRNFFIFDLPVLPNAPFSAQLLAKPYTMTSPTNFVDYRLRDVSTPITALTNDASGATATFADLGTGDVYGGRNIFTNEVPAKVSIPLNGLFTGAAYANSGGQIALGGSLILDPTPNNDGLFGFSPFAAVPDDVQLWLGFVPAGLPSCAFVPVSPTHLGGNNYQFTLSGTTGTTNEIQMTTDFVNWDVVTKLHMTNVNTTFNHTDSLSNRFFRARYLQ